MQGMRDPRPFPFPYRGTGYRNRIQALHFLWLDSVVWVPLVSSISPAIGCSVYCCCSCWGHSGWEHGLFSRFHCRAITFWTPFALSVGYNINNEPQPLASPRGFNVISFICVDGVVPFTPRFCYLRRWIASRFTRLSGWGQYLGFDVVLHYNGFRFSSLPTVNERLARGKRYAAPVVALHACHSVRFSSVHFSRWDFTRSGGPRNCESSGTTMVSTAECH